MTETDKHIIARIDTVERYIDGKLEGIRDSIDKLTHFIEGNGQPGLKIRLDRLEQSEARRNWTVKAVAGAMIGAFITSLWALLAK